MASGKSAYTYEYRSLRPGHLVNSTNNNNNNIDLTSTLVPLGTALNLVVIENEKFRSCC